MTKIDHKKIWTEIGDAFATPYKDRTERQKHMTFFGLCWAFWEISGSNRIYSVMEDLGNSMSIGHCWWKKERGESGFTIRTDRERATFAYFMAAMGNKGYEELIKEVTP